MTDNRDLPEVPNQPLDAEPRPVHLDHADSLAVLTRELDAAGVELGTRDQEVAEWVADWDGSTVITIASWIRRAAEGGRR